MASQKIAVVTGSNKGIGYAIVKGLCEKFNGDVYLTSRDVARGQAAVEKLKQLGFNPLYHQLDITDQTSVDRFKEHVQNKHGGIDILINNAAMANAQDTFETVGEQAEVTITANYFGTLRVCEALFPLIRENGKVVNVTSALGHLSMIPSVSLRRKFSDPNLTIPALNDLMKKFISDAKKNKHAEEGWPTCFGPTYVMSKVGTSALSIIQQRNFDNERPTRNISVNHVHPGYVDTDMTKHKGKLTIEQGAKAPLFCALEADFKGKYVWYNCDIVDWYADKVDLTM